MVEFTDRDRKIMIIMDTLIQPALRDVPQNVREAFCKGVFQIMNIQYNEQEVIDMIQAIVEERKLIDKTGLGLLGKYGHLIGKS